jgi:hypothetical protein
LLGFLGTRFGGGIDPDRAANIGGGEYDGGFSAGLDGKRKARPPVALIVVAGVEVKGASRESD